jgi:hypothetical protein
MPLSSSQMQTPPNWSLVLPVHCTVMDSMHSNMSGVVAAATPHQEGCRHHNTSSAELHSCFKLSFEPPLQYYPKFASVTLIVLQLPAASLGD